MRLWSIVAVAVLLVSCAKDQGAESGKEPGKGTDKTPPPAVEPKTVEKPTQAAPPKGEPAVEGAKPEADATKGTEGAAVPADATKGTDGAAVPAGDAAQALPASNLPELAKSALAYLPDQLQAVVAVDLEGTVSRLDSVIPLVSMLGVAQDQALRDELSAFIRSRVGLDPLAARGFVMAVTAQPAVWGLVKGEFRLEKTAISDFVDVNGIQALALSGEAPLIVLPLEGWGLALFDRQEAAAEFVDKVLGRKGPPAVEPALLAALKDEPGAFAAVAVDFTHPLIQAGWAREIQFPAPRQAALFVTPDKISARMAADEACINGILGGIEKLRAEAKAAVSAQKAKLDEMNLADGIAVILADRSLDRFIDFVTPKREGDTLSLSLAIDQFTTVTVIGSMAAIAIPAFLKYTAKAKVAEAHETLRKIRYAAEAYYCTPRVDEQGNQVPPQFPAAQAATPAAGTCCAELGGPAGEAKGRCNPDTTMWQTPTWTALNFMMLDPHYFAYEFTSKTLEDGAPAFDASAYGDLDCDGTRSTFRLSCKGLPVGDAGCSVECDPLYLENELE